MIDEGLGLPCKMCETAKDAQHTYGHRNIIQAIDPLDPGQAADLDNVGVRDGGLRRQLKGVPRPLLLRVAVPALGDLDSDLDALFREESRENSM
jgi:hypothetical protein